MTSTLKAAIVAAALTVAGTAVLSTASTPAQAEGNLAFSTGIGYGDTKPRAAKRATQAWIKQAREDNPGVRIGRRNVPSYLICHNKPKANTQDGPGVEVIGNHLDEWECGIQGVPVGVS